MINEDANGRTCIHFGCGRLERGWRAVNEGLREHRAISFRIGKAASAVCSRRWPRWRDHRRRRPWTYKISKRSSRRSSWPRWSSVWAISQKTYIKDLASAVRELIARTLEQQIRYELVRKKVSTTVYPAFAWRFRPDRTHNLFASLIGPSPMQDTTFRSSRSTTIFRSKRLWTI